ncbi:hypothetical protein D3C71_2023580 [compost metagenome]
MRLFPNMAATLKSRNMIQISKPVPPFAINAPTANNIESPGKNGVTTKPVSAKIIKKRIR